MDEVAFLPHFHLSAKQLPCAQGLLPAGIRHRNEFINYRP
ncbi:hypothetical protein HMPREF1326_01635 [Akkermansia sp. KLE1605]|nr:hypothetical protein HMPREF1326_01635 [Akkermansia sp. KLE1605]